MRHPIALLLLVLVSGCAKHSNEDVRTVTVDSLVNTHDVRTGDAITVDSTGLLIEKSRMRTPEHQQTIERFTPLEIVGIYGAFRPHRKAGLAQPTVDSFLAAHKITQPELQAILVEGDKLGWARVDSTVRKP